MTIEIQQLDVQYDADGHSDEAVFARLFARHIARHDQQRTHAADAEARAQCERSVSEGRGGW